MATIATMVQLSEQTVRDIVNLELAALGDHCLYSQLQPIISTALADAYKQGTKAGHALAKADQTNG